MSVNLDFHAVNFVMSTDQEGQISIWCNTNSKSAQKRLPEILSAVAAISQIKERYTVQFTDDDRLMVLQRRKRWLILLN